MGRDRGLRTLGRAEVGREPVDLRPGRGPASGTASRTRGSPRPLTTTTAPSRASASAIAKPIPAVEPVTSARLPRSCRSMVLSHRATVEPGGGTA